MFGPAIDKAAQWILTPVLEQAYGLLYRLGILEVEDE